MHDDNKEPKNSHVRLYHVYEKIGKLEGQMEGMNGRLDTVIKDHGDRINKVEEKIDHERGKTAGIAIAVSVIVSTIGLVIAFFRKLI